MAKENEFQPDWCSPPGETVLDILNERQLSLEDFASKLGEPISSVEELISGETRIDAARGGRLVALLGSTVSFWLQRDKQFQQCRRRVVAENTGATGQTWLRGLPLGDMQRLKWIRPSQSRDQLLANLLLFFGVPSVEKWETRYHDILRSVALRTSSSFESEPAAVAAWIRQGELVAAEPRSTVWDAQRFRRDLPSFRSLTRKGDPERFLPELRERCNDCGVAIAVVEAPKNCRASGAAFFYGENRPLIILSVRHLSDDHFWFTFFHEAGHLLLHSGKGIFIDLDDDRNSEQENEANQFASEQLVPAEYRTRLRSLPQSHIEVIRFARSVGVSPGIVVGQMQYLGLLPQSHLNRLKRRYQWHNGTLISRERP